MHSNHPEPQTLTDQIDDLLPQHQCGKCGFPGCRPYAAAIAAGAADIDRCPPGGNAGVRRLAGLLGAEPKPLNPAYGTEQPNVIAIIEESQCIGCTLCIQACPVDAILGAAKVMHTVITTECTGCELCVAPCPMNCIRLEIADRPEIDQALSLGSETHSVQGKDKSTVDSARAHRARQRYQARQARRATLEREEAALRQLRKENLKRALRTQTPASGAGVENTSTDALQNSRNTANFDSDGT